MSVDDLPEHLRAACGEIVRLICLGRYDDAVEMAAYSRCTPAELSRAVAAYGRTLTPPPQLELDVVAVDGSHPRAWTVWADLWSDEEGRSDLQVRLKATDGPRGVLLEIEDIRVP